jgi:hypothetical protein
VELSDNDDDEEEEKTSKKKNVRKRKLITYSDENVTSKQRKKKSKQRKQSEEHSEGDKDDDEESDYEIGKNFDNAFKKKKAKVSSRVRKQTNKKDAWIDDEENNQSLSSAPELDSDDEKRAENIEVDEDALLNLFNNYSSGEMQSMINVSDIKVEKIISNRPFTDLNDLVKYDILIAF